MKKDKKLPRVFKIKGTKNRENLRAIHLNSERFIMLLIVSKLLIYG